jgi:PAS domain S-box-containing protein
MGLNMNKTTSILVVDDDPAILQTYSEILRAEGYEVWEASTGHQGLQAARERRPDLVLLDVMLPDLSGMEVCRQIKAAAALADVFVVLVSGTAVSVAHKVDGLETGADDYLVKPLDVAEFLARLRTIVRLRNTTAALRASEQRHRQLVEILPEGVGLSDLQGRFLAVNPRGAEMLGYANPGELLGRSVFDVTRPEDHERVRADLATALATGTLRNAECLLLRKGGDPFPAELSAAVAAAADGQPTGIVLVAHETTERKRIEEVLQGYARSLTDNALFLQTLMDAIPAPVFYKDAGGRYLGCNKALEQYLGVSQERIVGRTVYDVAPKDLAEVYHQADQELLARPSIQTYESAVVYADGTRHQVIFNKATFQNAEGEVAGLVGVIHDITERKWVENLLRLQRDFGVFLSSTGDLKAAAERLLKIVLENEGLDGGAVYLLNPETEALDLAAHLGLSAGFAKRASHFAAAPVRDRLASAKQPLSREQAPPLAGILRRLRREGLLALEALPIQYGGQVVAVLAVGARVRGEFPAKERQAIDALAAQAGGAITRIRAEQSMRASRQLLEKTIYNLQAAVIIADARTTTIQECNPAATRMFGHGREEMIGQTPSLLHLNEAARKEFRRHLQAAVKEKGVLSEFEFEMKRKDGTSFPAEATLVPIRNEKGQIVTWVGVFRDITERKQTEAGLRQLSRRILEAQEAERQRVARELHDSVNQVIASAKMRVRRVAENALLNPVAREQLARCDELLVQALEENRRIAHDLRPGDLDAVGLAEACRNLCRQFEARTNVGVKTRLARLAQRWPPATELNLYRIVQEALNNVAKHARARTVRLQIALQRGDLLLRIQDDGRGFDPNAVKSVRRKGEGIGLSNMRERAAILGATCEVESAPNQGTTITVRVPAEDQGPGTRDH